ncbi:hypothetical protein AHF37_08966, partial [Paragonimus kellicotti]
AVKASLTQTGSTTTGSRPNQADVCHNHRELLKLCSQVEKMLNVSTAGGQPYLQCVFRNYREEKNEAEVEVWFDPATLLRDSNTITTKSVESFVQNLLASADHKTASELYQFDFKIKAPVIRTVHDGTVP